MQKFRTQLTKALIKNRQLDCKIQMDSDSSMTRCLRQSCQERVRTRGAVSGLNRSRGPACAWGAAGGTQKFGTFYRL